MKRFLKVGRIVFLISSFGFSFLTLSACSSLTGLIDAADEFGCPRGSGVNCTTLTETHARITEELDKKEKQSLTLTRERSSQTKDTRNVSNPKEEASNSQALSSSATESTSALTEGNPNHLSAKTNATPFPIESLEVALEAPKNFTPLEDDKNFSRPNYSKAVKGKSFHASSNTTKRNSRIEEKVLLLWILPWVDTDGDLHGESRLWVRVRDARWGIEKLRREAMRRGPAGENP